MERYTGLLITKHNNQIILGQQILIIYILHLDRSQQSSCMRTFHLLAPKEFLTNKSNYI